MLRKIVLSILISNIYLVNCYIHLDWDATNPAFESSFYEEFLDPEQCQEQLAYIRNNTLLALQFTESGLKIPRSILGGNLVDLGNYYQCLGINHDAETTNIEGKYCLINVPLDQDLQFPTLPELPDLPEWIPEWPESIPEWPEWIPEWPEWLPELPEWIDFDPRRLRVKDTTAKKLKEYNKVKGAAQALVGSRSRTVDGTPFENLEFTLAVCVPKTCTTQEGINGLYFNFTAFGLNYKDNLCRLNNDKPWTPADYTAVVIFSILGLITLLSTSYDVCHIFVLKSDPKAINPMYRVFSLYTNARRLTTFTKNPNALECVDGIRAISMMWVILGHTFTTLPMTVNALESLEWTLSFGSLWVSAAPLAVDTFFMLGGLLLVYTTAGKLSSMKLLKNIHLFYLNRLLRMFPLLAAGILVQASFLYRLTDGPLWDLPAVYTERCRNFWWSTLLYIQNFSNAENMCLPHSWYLAMDIQLHIISPLILYWVLSGNKKSAWISMSAGLLSFLTASTVYIFIMEFPGGVIAPARDDEHMYYMVYYYLNTLTRAAPFFVGMMFGYLLHLWKGKKVEISKVQNILLWICAFVLTSLAVYSNHPVKDMNWDNQTVDSLVNAYSRSIWVAGIGCMIFACVHGYGGPINWFLSLQLWKVISRVSYGMYIFHYPIMYITAGRALQPIFFSELSALYRFLSEFSIAFIVSFAMTLFIDSPFSTVFKILMGGGPKKPEVTGKEQKNGAANGGVHVKDNVIDHKYSIKL